MQLLEYVAIWNQKLIIFTTKYKRGNNKNVIQL